MSVLPPAVFDLYRAQQDRILTAREGVRGEWSKIVSPSQFGRVSNSILALLVAAQLGAAKDGAAMVPTALAQQGEELDQLGRVNPAGFAGWASDGRSLESLVWLAPQIAADHGGTALEQMTVGRVFLDLVTQVQIADAGRAASSVGIAATPRAGYYRYVSPPCCADCAIQAGRWFRYNTGFDRHPNCDCVHLPAIQDTPAGFSEQPSVDQITGLSAAERKAIEDGASPSMVVNARRGASKMTTTEGTTRRGYASYMRRAIDSERGQRTDTAVVMSRGRNATRTRGRLTPEAIYRVSATREEAVRRLIENGYVVGDIRALARSVA